GNVAAVLLDGRRTCEHRAGHQVVPGGGGTKAEEMAEFVFRYRKEVHLVGGDPSSALPKIPAVEIWIKSDRTAPGTKVRRRTAHRAGLTAARDCITPGLGAAPRV